MHSSEAHALCHHCMNCKVRIETVYGHEIEGTIVHLDDANVYLRMPGRALLGDAIVDDHEQYRPYYGHGNQDVILTLSLFLLLTIVLL
ncbi:hypothetical protein E0485_06375 [Paenibacillus albiflavus]|uniref:Uncharacterized protein n=1 Tax=Paenibacillus albiflavus TaxID=2545760 RepID=A0A4R4EHX2_9BACL|nr:hypothetical protein [Paenibacillus albiflavus]TCZ79479.1 hypothetical protein E0485_06375 [Paenibacillus albiflavus]